MNTTVSATVMAARSVVLQRVVLPAEAAQVGGLHAAFWVATGMSVLAVLCALLLRPRNCEGEAHGVAARASGSSKDGWPMKPATTPPK